MDQKTSQAIRRILALGVAAALATIWGLSNRRTIGEWMRGLSDIPGTWVLVRTSGFESKGRDPSKEP